MKPDRLDNMKRAYNQLAQVHQSIDEFGRRAQFMDPQQMQAQGMALKGAADMAMRLALMACLEGLIELSAPGEDGKGNGKTAPVLMLAKGN